MTSKNWLLETFSLQRSFFLLFDVCIFFFCFQLNGIGWDLTSEEYEMYWKKIGVTAAFRAHVLWNFDFTHENLFKYILVETSSSSLNKQNKRKSMCTKNEIIRTAWAMKIRMAMRLFDITAQYHKWQIVYICAYVCWVRVQTWLVRAGCGDCKLLHFLSFLNNCSSWLLFT